MNVYVPSQIAPLVLALEPQSLTLNLPSFFIWNIKTCWDSFRFPAHFSYLSYDFKCWFHILEFIFSHLEIIQSDHIELWCILNFYCIDYWMIVTNLDHFYRSVAINIFVISFEWAVEVQIVSLSFAFIAVFVSFSW